MHQVSKFHRLVTRALNAIKRQRLPDHSFLYREYFKYRPRSGINRPAGSLGRSHARKYALQIWGDPLSQMKFINSARSPHQA